MLSDNLKIFVHGLPLDCEEHSLKDFLEGKVYAKGLKGGTVKYFLQIVFLPYPKKSALNEPSELLTFSRVANHNRYSNSLLFI